MTKIYFFKINIPSFLLGDKKKYPTSHRNPKDWDKLVVDIKKEEEEEKPEGDAALNSLFQKIYADGSEETKRAMNKSFVSFF